MPDELKAYSSDSIIRYLPVEPERWAVNYAGLTEDPEAVAGWTMREVIKKPEEFEAGVKFEFFDAVTKKWVATGVIPKGALVPGQYQLHKIFTAYLPAYCRLVFGGMWGLSLDLQKLGRYYDPSYQQRQYEFWASLKCEGPLFDASSTAVTNSIACDQVFLINKGMQE